MTQPTLIQQARLPFVFALLLVLALLSACDLLQTREEADEKTTMQKQVQTLQKTTADTNQRFQDLEDDTRKLGGRLEVEDNQIKKLDQKVERYESGHQAFMKDNADKMLVYRDEIQKLQQSITDLNSQIQALQENLKRAAAAPPPSIVAKAGKSSFPMAEDLFKQKDFKSAIPLYEQYRKNYPSGRNWKEATYKIGVCFQELGLGDDAKAFFDELLAKAPGTPEAKKAATRLKALKRK